MIAIIVNDNSEKACTGILTTQSTKITRLCGRPTSRDSKEDYFHLGRATLFEDETCSMPLSGLVYVKIMVEKICRDDSKGTCSDNPTKEEKRSACGFITW